jgi:hypothetical protein
LARATAGTTSVKNESGKYFPNAGIRIAPGAKALFATRLGPQEAAIIRGLIPGCFALCGRTNQECCHSVTICPALKIFGSFFEARQDSVIAGQLLLVVV